MASASKTSALCWLVACALWCLLVLWLSLLPHPPRLDLPMLSWDKFQHAVAYGLLTLLAGKALAGLRGNDSFRLWLVAGLFALGFGVLTEVLQAVGTAGRSPEARDLLADAAGVGAVLAAVAVWRRLAGRRGPTI